MSVEIVPEHPAHAVLIDPLLDRTFGRNRRQRTTYRLRDGVPPIAALCFASVDDDGSFLGSLRFWPLFVGGRDAILLGPLAVDPMLQGQGIGKALVAHGLAAAAALGHEICIVVGPPAYYRPFGSINASAAGLIMPGPVEAARFQVMELRPGALVGLHGVLQKVDNAGPSAGQPPVPPPGASPSASLAQPGH